MVKSTGQSCTTATAELAIPPARPAKLLGVCSLENQVIIHAATIKPGKPKNQTAGTKIMIRTKNPLTFPPD
jgi:hypothetical protein